MLLLARPLSWLLAGCSLLLCAASAACAASSSAGAANSVLTGGAAFQHAMTSSLAAGMTLAEDRAGFIWVGTQSGLARWDGYQDRPFPVDPARPDALPDAYVRALHVDATGAMWVGTNAGGLARYAADTERFERIPDPESLVGSEISALADRTKDSLWIGGRGGLAWLDLVTRRLQRVPLPAAVGGVSCLYTSRDGALWVGGRGGLWRRTTPTAAFEPIMLPTSNGLAPRTVALLEDSQGNLWVGTRLHGAYVVQAGSTNGRPVREQGHDELSSDTVRGLVEAHTGEIWIGTYRAGIVRVDVATGRTRRERHKATLPSSLVDDSVSALLRSASGLVWVATNYALSRHDPQQDLTEALYGGPGRPVRADSVPAVLALPDGRIWLATGEAGAQILDRTNGHVTELRSRPALPESALPNARVISLAQSLGDTVWIGTQGGLYRARADGTRLQRVHLPGVEPSAEFWALHLRGHTLWVGGQEGLWSIELSATGEPQAMRRWEVPARMRVTALAATPDEVWVGTNEGLARLVPTLAQLEMLPKIPSDPTALPGGLISSLAIDHLGQLWVGSLGLGVQVSDGRRPDGSPRFRRIGTAQGLPHNNVDALLADHGGHIWASTDDGLARVEIATLKVQSFRAAQYVGLTIFWTGAGSILPSGELLFGGQGGALLVHPERVRSSQAPPSPVITEARIGGQAMPAAALLALGGATLPADTRSLTVEFASLSFTDRDELRYEYRLQGFDKDWVAAPPQRRLASYTNLPAGSYQLHMRVAPLHGDWSAPLVLPVVVQPHWSETLVARLGFVLLAVGLLAWAWHLRTLVMRHRQARLEALVAERTNQLELRTDQLHASQAQLEQLAYYDSLTGLANRRLFNEKFRRAVAAVQGGGDEIAVALIDLDRFKQVNDNHGHDAGDAVLVAAAQRLCQAVGSADLVGRLGGDEFVVLLNLGGHSGNVDTSACERIVETMALPITLPDGKQVEIGVSVGMARCPADATDTESLLRAADMALYEAKHAGRGQWRRWQRHPFSGQ